MPDTSRSLLPSLRVSLLLFGLVLCAGAPAAALDEGDPAAGGPAAGWSFSLGVFDVDKFQEAAEVGVEYRWQPFRLWQLDLKPVVGVSGNPDGGYWGYGGVRWDWPVKSQRWVPSLSFAVTAYEQGDGKDLGGVLQFRSGFDIAYRLDGGSRVGLTLYHLSNASIHDFNPGSESLVVFWSLGR